MRAARAATIAAVLVGVAACREPPPPAPPPGETEVAARSAGSRLVDESARVMITALAGADGRMRMYARVPGQAALVPVRDSTAWPDSVVSSFGVAADAEGRIVQVAEVVIGPGRDWENVYTHYFDAEGRTRAFVRESSFLDGCPGRGSRERTQSLFDARGRLLERRYTLSDLDGSPVDPAACRFQYRFPYRIRLSVDELRKEIGLPQP